MSGSTQISLKDRQSLIKNHPFFCLLEGLELGRLAQLMQEEYKDVGETIVDEGDLIDKIYFIAEGQAEVTRDISTIDKKGIMHVSFLNKGDVIGLAQSGLFSTTGTRTARVHAFTKVSLLSIQLSQFHTFLSNYPAIKDTAEKFLLMNRVRQISSFRNLNNDEIRHLAKEIKKIQIAENNNIFLQNTPAENCYLIIAGEVVIHKDGQPLKTLEPDTFFGEEALQANMNYTITAVAKGKCELFQLSHEVIFSFIEPKVSILGSIKQFFSKG